MNTTADLITVTTREYMAQLIRAARKAGFFASYERDNWMGRTLTVRTPSGVTRVFEYQP